ncbi:MAG: dihydrolipoyl dehydrogenase [Buchnera aphidicola (Pentalonia nigronervosa)]|jgi:dihydrolipoamide dehydrogenase|uniref:Dihydrolipoyl dehydrogenase n=1 Tax=Buchnera aphidicola (Pentalonia nigronervosa) TaxID=1309793 RepID=A0A7H1AZL9_9GAMM|nr:MAG: dihydrolipoyl dehydrogenase [Buchnera aphidicola (Pentalonia nigronervosa)]
MNQKIHAQVVVIGSGPSGYSAAFRCSDLGLETVLIECDNKLGGVCLNSGCIPSKSLLHISKIIKEAKELSQIGVSFSTPIINFEKVVSWKKNIIEKFNSGLSDMRKKRKIKLIKGYAKFDTKNSVVIENIDARITLMFENAIIATGSKSIHIPSLPNDKKIWNSTDALLLKKIPERFLIIGGGVIGLEMATIYSSLGSKIDIVDRFKNFFPSLDKRISDAYLSSIGDRFNLRLNTHIDSFKVSDDHCSVILVQDGVKQNEINYDAVLVAIGRSPNTDSIGLNEIGLEVNNTGFISVDKQLRTNISNIYAIGDVTGFPMLAHKGMHQGHIAAEVISGRNHYFEPKVIPSIAYTEPEIAWVGVSENEAKKKNINFEICDFPWNASARAIISNSSFGVTRLIFDKNSNKIIGGAIVGTNAGELISEIALAIEMGCDAEDIALTIHPHPTLSESICLSSEIFQGTITDLFNLKCKK